MHNSISACIPTYNDKLTNLLRVTESILNQTVPFKRITIIDDGSRNDLSLLKRSPNICLHKNPENKGRGFIRNQAIKNADTDYVLFCDSTNLLPKRFTEIAIHAFNDPKVAAVSGKISNSETLDSFITNWRARHLFKQGFNFGNTAQVATSLTTYGTIMKRSAVLDVGNFNQLLRHSEDRELGQRLIRSGFKIIGDPNLVVYSIKEDSIFSVLERYWRWYGGENEEMKLKDYFNSIKASFKPMIQQDLKAKDWQAAMISFLCPHYGYTRYLRRKFSSKLQKIN